LISAFDIGDLETARKLQQQSIDMITLLGKYGGIATGKAYMKLVGIDCGEFRLPVKNMTAQEFELFKSDTEKMAFKTLASRLPSAVNA
jgi:N-acetylneuraminate lyase